MSYKRKVHLRGVRTGNGRHPCGMIVLGPDVVTYFIKDVTCGRCKQTLWYRRAVSRQSATGTVTR